MIDLFTVTSICRYTCFALFQHSSSLTGKTAEMRKLDQRVCRQVKTFLKGRCEPGSTLVISISGGVDSMVLSHCLVALRTQLQLDLNAVHIDYNARPDSGLEAAFVETWAREASLPLTVVRLSEAEMDSRAAFEDFSRQARYNAYSKALQKNNALAVLTGHHEDDAAENVLSNLLTGRSLFHIPVLGPEALIEGVRIWRPFFCLPKEALFAFAQSYDIPHLKNNDDPTSRRAILHRRLIPALGDSFGQRTLKNIARVGQSAKDWKQIIDEQILAPFWKNIQSFPHGVLVPYGEYALWPTAFWEEALVGIFHAMGCSMLSKRSMDKLVYAIHAKKSTWLPVHKKVCLFVDSDVHQIMILNSKLFPHSQKDMGCWIVSSMDGTTPPLDSDGNSTLLGFLHGFFSIELSELLRKRHAIQIDLPLELAARLPVPDTILHSCELQSQSNYTGTLQLTAVLDPLVVHPFADMSVLAMQKRLLRVCLSFLSLVSWLGQVHGFCLEFRTWLQRHDESIKRKALHRSLAA